MPSVAVRTIEPSKCGHLVHITGGESSAAVYLARLWQEAGLPDGVFTVVHGDREAVDAIVGHPGHS
jgi:malonate-semialdehyde dehydrogenase (acetylating)/methylmalonate-semialdehyde dehydrogenase